jgi:WhiB family redox-sensing transcriptional regulator
MANDMVSPTDSTAGAARGVCADIGRIETDRIETDRFEPVRIEPDRTGPEMTDGVTAPRLSLVVTGFDEMFESIEEQWQERALCAQTDPEAFFPEKGGSTREAKRICLGCEVRDECLEYALAHDERFGIWGGLSERERRRLKRGIG